MGSRPFRFAVQGGPFGDADALAAHARHVESLGYDELWSADHIGGIDPFAPLLLVAHVTEHLRVGPLVLNNGLWNPVLLARVAASIDLLSDGRLVLGLGTGYAEAEHHAIGSAILPPGARVTRFGESLDALRRLLDDGSAHLDGEHVRVDVDDLGVRPRQARVPFAIGGHGRRVIGLAGRHADLFQFTGLVHGDGGRPTGLGFALDTIVERGRWLSEAAGDRDAEIERSALVQVVAIGDDAPSTHELSERTGLPADRLVDTPFLQVGSVAQIVDRLERAREALGISHYVVRDPDAFAPVVAALAGK
jgi:probable F420-dependent oxidoreductase